jgi:hypothetical protein
MIANDYRSKPKEAAEKLKHAERRQPSRLAFDYEGSTVTFASYLDDEETLDLLRRIRQRCALADCEKPEESSVKLSG